MPDPESADPIGRIARSLCRAGRELHRTGLVAGHAGNLSVRLSDGSLLITPRGTHKGRLQPADLVRVEPDDASSGEVRRASTELPFHRAAYAADPEIGAVVHVHGPALTAAGLRGIDLAEPLPEVAASLGGVRIVPFLPSASPELASAVGEAVRSGAAVLLLRRHGAVVVAPDLREALDRVELAELSAYAVLLARAGVPEAGS